MTHTIYIKDARFRQQPQTTPENVGGGSTTPSSTQKEANVDNSMGRAAAVAGGAYLGGKVVSIASQLAMYQISKIGTRNGNNLKQIRIQNTLNKIGLGKTGIAYGKSAAAGGAAGAAVGTAILPGLGTIIGIGVGTAIGFGANGISAAINIDKTRYTRERNNYELGQFEKISVWTNNNNRFAGAVK